MNDSKTHYNKIIPEPVLYSITVGFVIFSILMVYSTTGVVSHEKFGDSLFYVKRQLTAGILGVFLMTLFSCLNLNFLKKLSPSFFFICFTLLALLNIPGVGHSAGGAQRWISFGVVNFQPGELVKLLFIIFIAGFLSRHEETLSTFKDGIIKPSFLIMCVGGLFLLQPDFGSFVVIASVSMLMAAVVGVKPKHLALCIVSGLAFIAVLVIISPYRMARVVSFLDPFRDPAGKGYQLIQSLIAVGSGKVTGLGLGASQQKLFFLPAAHTDFIFAVIGEELGFVGCLTLLLFFILFFLRGIKIAKRVTNDTFRFSLAVGLSLLIFLPALFNMGVVTGLLPTKGMVLPMIGYGGSSLITTLAGVGILMAVARSSFKQEPN